MSEDISINGPIEIKDNSKEKVAYDLAMRIATEEKLFNDQEYRKKLLDLYAECLYATRGYRDLA